ncbi:MAG: OB-fold nucleic acid binding domain-containing protein [Candidatus Verstraetearchaeota archaeon]|nr:OB-fold nucleic acid binding domain-containing protein [Candidatus Verstraetearchaeota archaeon]
MSDFDRLFSSLKEKSGLIETELKSRIEDKKSSLGHLVNDDVALRLVAKDLGVNIYEEQTEKPAVKIEDLIPGLSNISVSVRIQRAGEIKEFTRKDGSRGKVARVRVADETGSATLVLWDESACIVSELVEGTTISIHSAYTKQGFNGVELHIGQKGRIEIISKSENTLKGTVVRVYDPIDFTSRDGRHGRVVAFTVRNEQEFKVLVWNPSDNIVLNIKEGIVVEIVGGTRKRGLNGEPEIHINNEKIIKFLNQTSDIDQMKAKRLSEIKDEEKDLVVEGIIESESNLCDTQSGKQYVRLLLRDQEATLPITFWNEKAERIARMAKRGMRMRIEGCSSRFTPNGLEIIVNRWSRIILN